MKTKKAKSPKYKVGDMVYSYQNPTAKREINRIMLSDDPTYDHKYRLTLFNAKKERVNSNWINEKSLSKRKKSKK